ncbi:arsenite methyltransferase [Sulfurospirillum sp. T05]|uniref:Arsenite methyltransferase n=1 Tax=Sulfurospirillum tamanense TaxID=2813362 RepID=A0ABS2WP43_9BACT|nr:arsenite methyltransferase [Sulfurospirillum tamanensis]MBN2963381.1 arsenite methyltransferase [Sulfurospirillum tamanensis]
MITTKEQLYEEVRTVYGEIAQGKRCGCGPSCCGDAQAQSLGLGYSATALASVPKEANKGLGCGNPTAIASLKKGEVVVDLGSGAGLDAFLAAHHVGEEGRVIGVDMTPQMLTKARENARKGAYQHVEFRLGEIENLPIANGVVDVIISNCVINLSPDKPRVFKEAYRVLKPGGRLAISDMVALAPLPEILAQDIALYTGCLAGASVVGELENLLTSCGFEAVCITPKHTTTCGTGQERIEDYVVSATIEAVKPKP